MNIRSMLGLNIIITLEPKDTIGVQLPGCAWMKRSRVILSNIGAGCFLVSIPSVLYWPFSCVHFTVPEWNAAVWSCRIYVQAASLWAFHCGCFPVSIPLTIFVCTLHDKMTLCTWLTWSHHVILKSTAWSVRRPGPRHLWWRLWPVDLQCWRYFFLLYSKWLV